MGNQRARSRGLRHGTRNVFSRGFREKGRNNTTTYLRTFRVGDYVDIKVDASQQKGMPYLQYQGRTGIVWNVTPRAVGVEVNKTIGGRIARKRIHVRIEHVRRSRCNEDFLQRVKEGDALKAEAKKKGEKIVYKRLAITPKVGKIIKSAGTTVQAFCPQEFISNTF